MDFKFAIFLFITLFRVQDAIRRFPENFKFGIATASYQIEGAWNMTGKGENIWDHLTHTTNLVTDKSTGDIACDSYHLFKTDIEMLKELGVDFYRFSISWSRLLPTGFGNKINVDGLNYYNRLIDGLIAKGIQPAVTLYHWDLPQPLQQLGGWPNPKMADYYADYANIAFQAFGDRVKLWLTFNEPMMICYEGYGSNSMAPALNMNGIGEYLCAHTLLKAHAKVYHLYDKKFKPSQGGRIGLTLDASYQIPETDSLQDLEASERTMQFETGWYANPIYSRDGDYPKVMKERIAKKSKKQGFPFSRLPEFTADEIENIKGTYDFYGLNHYTSRIVKMPNSSWISMEPSYADDRGVIQYQDPSWPGSASPWLKVVPWGFTKLLGWIREHYDNPEVIIFENGFSDEDGLEDYDRIEYYHSYLNALLDAVDQGSNISGYTAWSLMDNFEWLAGYKERFGLYHVNFESPNRTRVAKDSALFYKEIIRDRAIKTSIEDYKSDEFVPFIVPSFNFQGQ